jgi:hypothetical protein
MNGRAMTKMVLRLELILLKDGAVMNAWICDNIQEIMVG